MASVEKITIKEIYAALANILKWIIRPIYLDTANRIRANIEILPTVTSVTTVSTVSSVNAYGGDLFFQEKHNEKNISYKAQRGLIT